MAVDSCHRAFFVVSVDIAADGDVFVTVAIAVAAVFVPFCTGIVSFVVESCWYYWLVDVTITVPIAAVAVKDSVSITADVVKDSVTITVTVAVIIIFRLLLSRLLL